MEFPKELLDKVVESVGPGVEVSIDMNNRPSLMLRAACAGKEAAFAQELPRPGSSISLGEFTDAFIGLHAPRVKAWLRSTGAAEAPHSREDIWTRYPGLQEQVIKNDIWPRLILILGPEGSGKTTMARALAEVCGGYGELSISSLLSPFELSGLLLQGKKTIIVDGYPSSPAVRALVTADKIMAEAKGKDPVEVKNPFYIFTAKAPRSVSKDIREDFTIVRMSKNKMRIKPASGSVSASVGPSAVEGRVAAETHNQGAEGGNDSGD